MLTAPLDLVLEAAAAGRRASIGPDGGTIAVTNARGTTFTFTVPAGALSDTVDIAVTPTASVGRGGDAQGVVFQPTGLSFVVPATLAIAPRTPVPVPQQLLFEFSDDGTELLAAEPALDTAEMVILVGHFSGYGFADLADKARDAYVGWKTDRAEARLENEITTIVTDERQREFAGEAEAPAAVDAAVAATFERYEKEVVLPRLQNAGTSCASALKAMATTANYLRRRQLGGGTATTVGGGAGQLSVGGVSYTMAQILAIADAPCEKEAIERCKAAKDPGILVKHWADRDRRRSMVGVAAGSESSTDRLHKAEAICDPQAYRITGELEDWQVDQTVCNIMEPFTMSSEIGTMKLSGGLSGSYSFGGVFASAYTGTHTVTFPDGPRKPGTMVGGGRGTIASSGGSGTERYVLVPVGPAC